MKTKKITVTAEGESRYKIVVEEGGSRSVHHVVATPQVVARYAPSTEPERLLKASFEFLLEREPKESILKSFELPVIERYFPEYPRKIRDML